MSAGGLRVPAGATYEYPAVAARDGMGRMKLGVKTTCLVFGLLASAALAAPGNAAGGLFNPEVHTLENGLRLLVIPDHRAPVVNHMVWYPVGSGDEVAGKSGLSHFLEHLMFKGTEKIPPAAFSKIIQKNGGEDNAFTSLDYTAYYQNVARDKLGLVMSMEADRMVNLRLDEEVVRTEREVVLEERRMRVENDPGAILRENMRAVQYMSHPYGLPLVGWEEEIAGLTMADALAFYRRHYAPNNAIVIVAGDVTGAEALALAEQHYGPLKRRAIPPRKRPPMPPQRAARRVVLEDQRVRQPSFRRIYLAPSRHAGETRHATPLRFLSQILGSGSTSRLSRKLVREQKIATGAGSWYHAFSYDGSSFGIWASPVPGGGLEALETAVDEVLADLLAGGIESAELERTRNELLASTIYARDDLGSGPRFLGAALTSGATVEDVESWPDRVREVTAEDIVEAARAVLDIRRSVTGYLLPKAEAGGAK